MRLQHQPYRQTENFPVASRLLPAKVRREILIFYDYVRGLDNIADAGDMTTDEKQSLLSAIADAVALRRAAAMPDWVGRYIQAVAEGRIASEYGEALMRAFWQDTHQTRYNDWVALLDYCRYSAVPVGRLMLAQLGETSADLAAADALCTLLQLLNHLQDLAEDYTQCGRIYLPADWMHQAGMTPEMLAEKQLSPQAAQVYARMLDACARLLSQSGRLPDSVSGWRLRAELRWMIALAGRLLAKLRASDPLAGPVALSQLDMLAALYQSFKAEPI